MQQNGSSFPEEDLSYNKEYSYSLGQGFKLAKPHLQTKVKDVMADLVVIKEQIKVNPMSTHDPTQGNAKKTA
jgi:hypothetical protein